MLRRICIVLGLALCLPVHAFSAPPVVGHQGVLTDPSGTPLNGTLSLTFRMYAAPTGGSVLWTETQPAVQVTDGVYAVALGSQTALPAGLFDGGERFLEVQVGSETLAPRQRIASVPYALSAQSVEQSPLSGISQLAGLPCNAANPAAGVLQIGYSSGGAVTLSCSNVYTLSVTISGGFGGGTGVAPPVTSSPAGINCGPGQTPDCSENFVGGTQVTLTATGNFLWVFVGWSGACTGTAPCVITMNAAKSVTATWVQNL